MAVTRWRVCTEGVYAAVTRWRVRPEGVHAVETNVAHMHGGCIRSIDQLLQGGVYTRRVHTRR